MFVEWVRSCYSSRWRVWNDSDQAIGGRYYRVPHSPTGVPLVPPYPGPTIFGSREWHEKNWPIEQPALGEVLDAKHTWDNGNPPLLPPLPAFVGDEDCIANGETIIQGLPLTSAARYDSWPTACFILTDTDVWGRAASVYTCRVQRYWADRVAELEANRITDLTRTLEARFPGAVVTFHDGEVFFPKLCTVVHPDYSICMYAATANLRQALVEVIEGVLAPVDRGGFSTTLLWQQQAQRGLMALSADGANGARPVLFVGYSYGGAAAMVAAAMCRLERANRTIRYLTYGAPKPGDGRLQDLLALPTRGCALANRDDLITLIPPDRISLLPAQVVLGQNFRPWALWEFPRETWIQEPDGSVRQNEYPVLATGPLLALIAFVIANRTFFGYPAHNINQYRARLALRCPGPGALRVAGGLPAARLDVAVRQPAAGKAEFTAHDVALGSLALVPAVPTGTLALRTAASGELASVGLVAGYNTDGKLAVSMPPFEFPDGALGIKDGGVPSGRIDLRGNFNVNGGSLVLCSPTFGTGCNDAVPMPYDTLVGLTVPANTTLWCVLPQPAVLWHLRFFDWVTNALVRSIFWGNNCGSLSGPFTYTGTSQCENFAVTSGANVYLKLDASFKPDTIVSFKFADGVC